LSLAAALSCAGACTKVGGAAGGGRHSYTEPHILRFAAAADIQSLNPLISATAYEMYLATMTMAFLIKTDAHGDAFTPELCTAIPSQQNGGISADGKTITYHLRRGVRWSDGAPFDADDVVFSTRQVLNKANNVVSLDGWDLIGKIDEPDKYTVVYHLKKPYSSFAVTFFSTGGANPAIMPKHLLQGLPSLNSAPYNALPVGIGPFKYERWNRGDSVELVANDSYFRGRPKLDRVIFKIIPDRNTTLQQLRTHEIDIWLPVSPHYYPDVKSIPGMKVTLLPSYTFDHMDFNLTHPVLQDVAVRRALRSAIDRKAINDKINNGLYILTDSPVTPASAYLNRSIPLVPFDLAKAAAMLDRAGWRRGPDGVRVKNGLRLNLVLASSAGSPDSDSKIELIRAWWKQLGVGLDVKHYQASLFFAQAATGGIIYGGKFDVVNFGWGTDPNEDLSNLYACYRFPPNGQDDMHWCNPAATAAMDAAKESYERSVRARYIAQVQQYVFDDVPTVILDARRDIYAYNDDLRDWNPNPVEPFDDMLKVDI
jgi:peptide/nickel transport system substrate-binding protein